MLNSIPSIKIMIIVMIIALFNINDKIKHNARQKTTNPKPNYSIFCNRELKIHNRISNRYSRSNSPSIQ